MARFQETTALEITADRIDSEQGILRDVKILGENSANGRRYLPEAMREAVPLYDGVKCYVDHPRRDQMGEDRSFDRWAGTFHNPRYKEGQGIFADLRLRKQSDYFAGIIEAAQQFPTDVGFSHVADGDSHLDKETEIVESIKKVFSGDLVTDPATTAGMFESKGNAMSKEPKTKTAKQIAEAAPEATKHRKLLVEMIDAGAVPADMAVEMPEEADPAAEVALALEKAAVSVLKKWFSGDIEQAAAIAQIKKIFGMKDDAAESTEAPAETPAAPTAESVELAKLKNDFALMEAKTLLIESGREASQARIKALASAASADRKELLESWPKPAAGEVIERPASSPGVIDSSSGYKKVGSKKFAEAIR